MDAETKAAKAASHAALMNLDRRGIEWCERTGGTLEEFMAVEGKTMTDAPQPPRCEPPAVDDDGLDVACEVYNDTYDADMNIETGRFVDNKRVAMKAALEAYLGAVPAETAEEVAALRREFEEINGGYQELWLAVQKHVGADDISEFDDLIERLNEHDREFDHLDQQYRDVLAERDSLRAALEQAVELESSIHLDLLANGDTCPCGNGRVPTGAYRAATAAYAKAIRAIIPVAPSTKETTVSEELKPCPLCGSTQHVALETAPMAAVSADRRAHVHCWKCGASGPVFEDMRVVAEAKATTAWNRRAAEPQEASDEEIIDFFCAYIQEDFDQNGQIRQGYREDMPIIRKELRRLGLRVMKVEK